MKNTISERVADFLKNYPPFSALESGQLETLSYEVTIVHKENNSIIFSEKEAPHDCFYVVHKGAVALTKKGSTQILDICDEGDIFGLRPLLAHENYKLEAKAHEETILYAIPIKEFKPLALQNHRVGDFLIESFASNTRNPYSQKHRGNCTESPLPRGMEVERKPNCWTCSPCDIPRTWSSVPRAPRSRPLPTLWASTM